MKKLTKIFSMIFFIFLISKPSGILASTNIYQKSDIIHLPTSTNESISFEIHLPLDKLVTEKAIVNGKEFIKLSIPGWSQISREGEPQLPKYVEKIGVPFGAEFEVFVTPGKKHIQDLEFSVLPVPTQFIDWDKRYTDEVYSQNQNLSYKFIENKEIYEVDKVFPNSLAEVVSDGIMRNQRIIGVNVFPVQYFPITGELILYESVLVTIKFKIESLPTSQMESHSSDIYEDILRGMLVNYEDATKWREDPAKYLTNSGERGSTWLPPNPGWRLSIQEEGFYRLSYDELYSAGVPVDTLDPRTIQIFNQGSEIAIHILGEDDGIFEESDHIIFFGKGIDSKYTANNIYWLTYGKLTQGLRIELRDATPFIAETPLFYKQDLRIEENNDYISLAPGDEKLDRWLSNYIYAKDSNPASISYSFDLKDPYPASATIRISLLGYLRHSINPDHHIKVFLTKSSENIYLGEIWWDGLAWELLELPIDANLLTVGENSIMIECPNDSGVTVDLVYVDWLSIEYSNRFIADDDKLEFLFEEEGIWKFQVEGFSTNDISVYDVSNPNVIEQLTGLSINSDESGYMVEFEDTISDSKRYQAMTNAKMMAVHGIEQDVPSNIQSSLNGAEYLIITHGDFSSQAQTLKTFREGQGLVSESVDVQDIYDEFNYGIIDVDAIRNFLAYTIENWDPYPSYVVLLGDGHYNPKGYNPGLYDIWQEIYIPPYLAPVDPTILETAADNRYVTLVGDDNLPDMMLGRLAVNTTEEATAVVEKIIAYETTPMPGHWREQILAVTDNPDNAGNFYLISDNLLGCCLPEPYNAEKIYYQNTHLTKDAARTAIQDGINSGKLIVNYIGHATTPQWAGEGLFKVADIDNLQNGDMMPIMLPMTCMDGYFIYPGSSNQAINPSLGESITRAADKGAIASWSPTGWGNVSGHDILNRGFFNALFQSGDGMLTLGMATQAGKINLFSTGTNQDLMDTYLLFGDPATRIAFDFTAVYDNYEVEEDKSLDVSSGEPGKRGVLNNDIHPQNSPLSAVLVEDVTDGHLDFHSDGSFTYIPNPNYFGTDSFTYYATDSVEDSNIAVVEITILPVNEKIFLPIIQN